MISHCYTYKNETKFIARCLNILRSALMHFTNNSNIKIEKSPEIKYSQINTEKKFSLIFKKKKLIIPSQQIISYIKIK